MQFRNHNHVSGCTCWHVPVGTGLLSWRYFTSPRFASESVSLKKQKFVSEPGFDPGTCGLWAHHASTAPLRTDCINYNYIYIWFNFAHFDTLTRARSQFWAGFKKDSRSSDCLFVLRSLILGYYTCRGPLHLLFLDRCIAYDSFHHPLFWRDLANIGYLWLCRNISIFVQLILTTIESVSWFYSASWAITAIIGDSTFKEGSGRYIFWGDIARAHVSPTSICYKDYSIGVGP